MKYTLAIIGLFALLLFTACAPFGSDPTPAPDVAALQTEAAAIGAVNDAKATLTAGSAPPPAVLTRQAIPAEIQTATAAVAWTEVANTWATVTALAAPQP